VRNAGQNVTERRIRRYTKAETGGISFGSCLLGILIGEFTFGTRVLFFFFFFFFF
jgi:hypothetical protein